MTGFQIGVCIFLACNTAYQIVQAITSKKSEICFGYMVGVAINIVIIIGLISKW